MRSPRGLSLVELLVALVLLSVGAISLAGGGAAAMRAARQGRSDHEEILRVRAALEASAAQPCDSAGQVRLLARAVTAGPQRGATLFAAAPC